MIAEVFRAYDAGGRAVFRPSKHRYAKMSPNSPMGRHVTQPLSVLCGDLNEVRQFLLTCRYISDSKQFGHLPVIEIAGSTPQGASRAFRGGASMGWPLFSVLLAWFAATGPMLTDQAPNFHLHCNVGSHASDCEAYEKAVHKAIARLPKRSPEVAIIDADDARPEVRETLLKLDAFITRGGRVVYVVKQSAVLNGAAGELPLYDCMLASIIWHEMAHIDGADERGARRAEEHLWTQFVRDEAVDAVTGLRYLQAFARRPDDQLTVWRYDGGGEGLVDRDLGTGISDLEDGDHSA
jgi:hypothetical protein